MTAELNAQTETKTCTKCASVRPLDAFSKRKTRDGSISHGRVCRDCKSASFVASMALKKAAAPGAPGTVVAGTKVCRVCLDSKPLIKFQRRLGVKGDTLFNGACNECTRGPGARARKQMEETRTGLRECTGCKALKPLTDFKQEAHNRSHCKACRQAVGRANWAKNKPVYAKRDPRIRMLSGAKARATEAGVPFDLKLEDLFVPEFCPVLGVKLERGRQGFMHNSPTIDRLVPSIGYAQGNVAVISGRANRLKNDGTAEEHERVAAWMRSQGLK